jgi:hypothetical protein
MDPWNILNIDPTENISIIKKAYAQKLKIHHPEDDPQGYQNLRQAYDNALKYAKRIDKSKESQSYETETSIDRSYELQSTLLIKNFPTGEKTEYENSLHLPIHMEMLNNQTHIPSIYEQNAEFMVQVESLYNNFFSRIDIKNWKVLLNNDLMWNIDNKRTLSNLMLNFLSCHHYLPQEVWIILDDNFYWCNRDNNIYHFYNDEFIMYIQKQITDSKPLNYSFFKPLERVDYEKFLEYREKAYDNFTENNLPAANRYIERANTIYQYDPDLLRLEGEISLHNGNINNAISAFSKTISINPNDLDAIFHRATSYYEKKQLQEALEDYTKVYSKTPDKNEIPLLMGKSYFKIGALEKAKYWTLQSLIINSSHNEAKAFLSQIYAKLRIKLTKELEKDPSSKDLKLRLDAINREALKGSKKITDKHSNNKIINSKIIIIFLVNFIKFTLYAFLILFILALAFATKIGILILIFKLFKHLISKKD